MSDTTKIGDAGVNAEATALAALLDSGYLRIYDGSQPATVDTAVSTQTLLAELRFSATSQSSITNGVITFDTITPDSSATAGTAAWFRALKSDGTTGVWDGSVGTSGATIDLNSVSIAAGAQVSVTALTLTVPTA